MNTHDKKERLWQSVSDLSAQTSQGTGDEFADQLEAEEMDGQTRRHFMGIMGASMAMASMSGCVRRPVEKIMPYSKQPEHVLPGSPTHYATAANIGQDVVGLLVESNDGRPTKIEGNPFHGWSVGGTSAAHQAMVLDLYDPLRLTTPRKANAPVTWNATEKFCQTHFGRFASNGGQGLVVFSDAVPSPALERLRRRFNKRYPRGQWFFYDSISADNEREGLKAAFGKPTRAVYSLDRARVIFSLDADFLSTGHDSVANSSRWAKLRNPDDYQGNMSRLYVAEGIFSLTGSNADHRLRVRTTDIPQLTFGLAWELVNQGMILREDVKAEAKKQAEGLDEKSRKFIRAVADDLMARSPSVGYVADGIVVAGRRQPPVVHTIVAAINKFLDRGNGVVSYFPDSVRPDDDPGDAASLQAAVDLLNGGTVDTFVILGGNPVYTTPGDVDFLAAMKKAKTVVSLSDYPDETSKAASWAIPRAHFLEAWGTLQSSNGLMSIQQPLIEPLHGAWSELEMVSRILGDEPRDGYSLVRRYFEQTHSATDVKRRWRNWLHDGMIPFPVLGSLPMHFRHAYAATQDPNDPESASKKADFRRLVDGLPQHPAASSGSLDLVFVPDGNLHDGRFSQNSWLQEAPDSISKITWDNAAYMSRKTAYELGIAEPSQRGKPEAQRITVEVNGKSIPLIAWIVPGIADYTLALPLGYGREFDQFLPYHDAGKVGFDVNPLRSAASPDLATGASVSKASGMYPVACVQRYGDIVPGQGYADRQLTRRGTVEEYRLDPKFAKEGVITHGKNGAEVPTKKVDGAEKGYVVIHPPEEALHGPPAAGADYSKGYQWGMTIDLNSCTGCNSCLVACVAENNIPSVGKQEVRRGREMHWIRIDRYFEGDGDEPQVVHQPLTCVHCEMAPCENVCPVQATAHGPEGTNDMAYNRCIGTRYCSNNCPFKVRRFNYFNYAAQSTWWEGLKLRDGKGGGLFNLAKVDPERDDELLHMVRNPDVTVRFRGVMEKCSYCIQRIVRGKRKAALADDQVTALKAIADITPACGQSCPTNCITFGDINDPQSEVSKKKRHKRNYRPLTELNLRARTSYLAKIRNPNPELASAKKG